jgi:hypothetical protein
MVAAESLSARSASTPWSSADVLDAPPVQCVLPVDPGFTVEAEVAQKFVKGEDLAFCYRAHPGLLGRPMRPVQTTDPALWQLNYDVFVVCDGHSGNAVRHRSCVRCRINTL